MQFSVKLLESNTVARQLILEALLPDIKSYVDNALDQLKTQLPPILNRAVVETPEYESLLAGKLRQELGIVDGASKVAGLLSVWSSTINIERKGPSISNGNIRGNFSVNMVRIDFSDVIYSEYASMVDTMRGYSLPWLEWLLLEGNRTIIDNHEIVLGANPRSRTGSAIMINSKQSWRIPTEFVGTIEDNWITRAIDSVSSEVEDLLQKVLS